MLWRNRGQSKIPLILFNRISIDHRVSNRNNNVLQTMFVVRGELIDANYDQFAVNMVSFWWMMMASICIRQWLIHVDQYSIYFPRRYRSSKFDHNWHIFFGHQYMYTNDNDHSGVLTIWHPVGNNRSSIPDVFYVLNKDVYTLHEGTHMLNVRLNYMNSVCKNFDQSKMFLVRFRCIDWIFQWYLSIVYVQLRRKYGVWYLQDIEDEYVR